MAEQIRVRLDETRGPGRVRREARFADRTLWWEIEAPTEALPAPLMRHDIAATALVFFAMHHGAALHVDGPVSGSLLRNLEDFVACWAVWRPDLYRRIAVTAAEEVDDGLAEAGARGRAVAAFSGGVDASFTLLRHARGDAGRRSRQLLAGVLIHGLDIPLGHREAFEAARVSAQASLASLGVPLAVLRTNWKAEFAVAWEMEFGTAVAAGLRNWQGSAAAGLLGSDEDYSRLVLPWGGNPISYAMLSAHDFTVVYDGGECPRTEKVEYLQGWAEGLRNLRVCWAGPMTGRNFGACEKCLRTKLNFMALGAALPSSLAGAPSLGQVLGLYARNPAQAALLEEIADIARARGIDAPWVGALRAAIVKSRCINGARAVPVLDSLLRRSRAGLRAFKAGA